MKANKRTSGGDKEEDRIHGDKVKEAAEVHAKKRAKKITWADVFRKCQPGVASADSSATGDHHPNAHEIDGNENEVHNNANDDRGVTSASVAVAKDFDEVLVFTNTSHATDCIVLDDKDDFPALSVPLNERSNADNLQDTSTASSQGNEQPGTSTPAKISAWPARQAVRIKIEPGEGGVEPIKGLDLKTITKWLNTQDDEVVLLKQQLQLQTDLKKKAEDNLKVVKVENKGFRRRIVEMENRMKDLEDRLQESQRQNEDWKRKANEIKQLLDSEIVTIKHGDSIKVDH